MKSIFFASLLLLLSVPGANAQLKSDTALFPLTPAGPVTAQEMQRVQQALRQTAQSLGYAVMSREELGAKLKRSAAPLTEFCEENETGCFAEMANRLGVTQILSGYLERTDQRLAVDIRLFKRLPPAKTGEAPRADLKQYIEYYVADQKLGLEEVCRRVVGKLLSRSGLLAISTNVDGAEIYINDGKTAVYPLAKPLVLPQGHYKITLRKSGYIEFSGEIDIAVEETAVFKGALKPIPFGISISSTPSNAAVYLGETNIGYTPLTNFQVLTFGKTPLKIVFTQYFDHLVKLDIVPGGSYQEVVALKPQFGDLLIVSTAIDSKVLLDGKFVGNTPLQLLERLAMGNHLVEIQNPNFFPFKQAIKVNPGAQTRYDLNPEPRFARLSVSSNVDRGRLYINDQFIGYTPYDDFVRLRPGHYRVKVSKPNHFDFAGEVDLVAGKLATLSATLQTQLATLSLTSNVIGAKVYLNDRYLGETPLKPMEEVPLGEYQLLLTRSTYYDYSQKITIRPGRVNNHFAEMITTVGKLQVETNVSGAQIFLGDRLLGMSPAPIFEKLPPGEGVLKINREGYESFVGPVFIKSNTVVTRKINLKPIATFITVSSTPNGASAYIDGDRAGTTPLSIPLRLGSYTLVIKAKGFRDYETKVSLSEGKPVKVDAVLASKPFELEVEANQSGAKVELNGVFIGVTPVDGYKGSSFGPQTLRISKSGFRTQDRKVNLVPGERLRIKVTLVPDAILRGPAKK